MPKRTNVPARRLFDIGDIVGDRHFVRVTVSANLEPVVLTLEQPLDYRIEKEHGSFPKKTADRSNSFRIYFKAGEEWFSVDLATTRENYHCIQPPGDQQWLLVRSRAGDEKDQNAHVYDMDGKLTRSFHAGDGIEDVQTTERRNIWISYFDEGVFGNTSLGQSGLTCFDEHGHPNFRFTSLGIAHSMADCYALNVCSNREIWLYYYTDFPLVKLENKELAQHWMVPVKGSHAFAVNDGSVLFGGSYEKRDSLFLGNLDELNFKELIPVDENGDPLRQFRAFGRRHHLYLETPKAVFLVDLKALDGERR